MRRTLGPPEEEHFERTRTTPPEFEWRKTGANCNNWNLAQPHKVYNPPEPCLAFSPYSGASGNSLVAAQALRVVMSRGCPVGWDITGAA